MPIPRCACGRSRCLPRTGTQSAAAEAAAAVRDLATSDDARERRAVAALFAARGSAGHDVGVLADLLVDGDLGVRAAALDAVVPSDATYPELVRRVVAALDEPRLAGPAGAAVRRLGPAAVPLRIRGARR